MKKFLIIQVCLLFVHIQVFSAIEKYNFHHLNVNNGLSTSDVWAIHKDSKGYMWFGTDYGLNRYNGIDFHTYYSIPGDSNSISFNIITSISEDSTGHIWVGTKYGLSVFRPELNSFKRYFHEPGKHSSLGNNKIKLIFTDSRSNIWISHGTGLDLYNPEEDNFIPITDLARNDKVSIPRGVYSMTEDMNGDLWLGSNTIYRLDIQDNMLIEYDLDIENVGVIYLHYTEKNILWAATLNGNVFYYNMVRDAFEILDPTRYKIDHFVNILGEDFYGNLLIGTDGGGLYLLENTTSGLTRIQHDPDDESSISNNTIAAIYTDKEGIFWLGNWRGGVNYANKFSEGFKLIRHRINDNNSLIHNNVRTIYEDSSGDLWYGTSDGFSWWEKDKNRINNFSTENSANLASNFITCFYEADNQTILIGTEVDGIFVFNKITRTFKSYSFPNSTIRSDISVYSIIEDAGYGLWFCTSEGLVCLDKFRKTVDFYNIQNSLLPSNKILSSYLDKDGKLWFGTNAGFCSYNSNENDFSSNYFGSDSILRNIQQNINLFFEDSKNNFWIGSKDLGLFLFDRESNTYKNFTLKDSLLSNVISSIIQDEKGNLWISSNIGLTVFDTDKLKVVRQYITNEGLKSNEYNPGSSIKDHDGKFYFGGINGITVIDPAQLQDNPRIPPVQITSVKLFDTSLDLTKLRKRKGKNESLNLVLKYNQNSISFDFIALNYTYPDRNLYSYKLEGEQDTWSAPSGLRTSLYNNLKPGYYKFRVIASNNDGLWNQTGASFSFRVLPPIWATGWAYAFYSFIFLSVLFLNARIIRKREKEKNLVLQERMESDKQAEVNRMKLEFFTNISHEFRTPLSLILAPIDDLKDYSNTDQYQKERLQLISRNAKRLQGLIGDLMTFRKLENGLLKLKLTRGNIASFVKETTEGFIPYARKRKIDLHCSCIEDNIAYLFDQRRMEEIILNILSNAVKFTPPGGKIIVSLKVIGNSEKENQPINNDDGHVIISIADSGIGIDKNNLSHIFERFYQASRSDKSKSGSGIGLAIVRALVELHHGEIFVNSNMGHGTEFIIQLPLNQIGLNGITEIENSSGSDVIMEDISDLQEEECYDSEIIYDESEATYEKNKLSVLMVEDNEELRKYLVSNLCKNFRIKEASNGIEGWDLALKAMPDIVVSDIIMPEMDGIELCRKLKNDIRTSHIPVILLTAKSESENKIEGFETGADAYIVKPFNFNILFAQIKNLISNRRRLIVKYIQDNQLDPEQFTTNKLDENFLKRTIQYIEEHISDSDLNVEKLGKDLCISRRHLYRKIKILTGESPVDFIKSMRLKKGLELLKQGEYSVSEIAYMAGFSSPSYFTNSFRRKYGDSPSNLLKEIYSNR